MQPAVRWAAALLVLGVAVATVPAHPTPSVMEVKHGWKPRAQKASASIAAAASSRPAEQSYYEEGYYEEKEVCLMETSIRDCGWQDYDLCDDTDAADGCRSPHYMYTSDVTCCQDNYDYGRHGHGSSSVGDHLWGPRSSVGSCDWTFHLITGDDWSDDNTDTSGNVPDVTDNIEKWGSATAICYFGADSQECGGPFCDRMVLTLEGAYYAVDTAYSYYPGTEPVAADAECATFANPGPFRMAQRGANSTRSARGAKAAKKAAGKSGSQPAAPKPAAAHTAADASTQYYHDDAHTSTVYVGDALVINGAVTAMIGPKKDKWENGLFEYTLAYDATSDDTTTTISPSIPWVRDKTYKFTFYKSPSY